MAVADAGPSFASVPVLDAATVMLVRDAIDEPGSGIEVFMLRRNLASAFVGGAYLFPGGAVDARDGHPDIEPWCAGRTDVDASLRLGTTAGGLAFWVAAIRECFEEAGVLLARDGRGELVDFADPQVDARFRAHRAEVDRGDRSLLDVCADEGLRLAVDALFYFSRWITPPGRPRRYDTRFFVAAAPAGQVPLHDDHEVIANQWVRPADALARFAAGTYDMRPPTQHSLRVLERFGSTNELFAALATVDALPVLLPGVRDLPQGERIPLPGDPGYEEAIAIATATATAVNTVDAAAAPPRAPAAPSWRHIRAADRTPAGGDHGP